MLMKPTKAKRTKSERTMEMGHWEAKFIGKDAAPTVKIVKRLEIDAGHRLLKHESKCSNIHGHRFAFEIYAEADQLDEVGRIVDFSAIKEVIGGWLLTNWDHGFIAQKGDPILNFLKKYKQKYFILDVAPTSENLSSFMLQKCQELTNTKKALKGIRITSVVVYETPSSRAEATF
jgi:6-pyruvoyltetrahydropterin/6-carboxytetrahydropterin synthase